jgi:hypothetical protein
MNGVDVRGIEQFKTCLCASQYEIAAFSILKELINPCPISRKVCEERSRGFGNFTTRLHLIEQLPQIILQLNIEGRIGSLLEPLRINGAKIAGSAPPFAASLNISLPACGRGRSKHQPLSMRSERFCIQTFRITRSLECLVNVFCPARRELKGLLCLARSHETGELTQVGISERGPDGSRQNFLLYVLVKSPLHTAYLRADSSDTLFD